VTIRALDNDAWGFETCCFVCERRNEAGLGVPFFHDTDRDVVFADFELPRQFSGAPTSVHGGVSLALVDEAMAWAAIAIRHRWAATRDITARFRRPVEVDRPHRVEARLVGGDERRLDAEATITDAEGSTCVSASASLVVYSAVRAPEVAGAEIPEELRSYLLDEE